jgi:hypothetical protein
MFPVTTGIQLAIGTVAQESTESLFFKKPVTDITENPLPVRKLPVLVRKNVEANYSIGTLDTGTGTVLWLLRNFSYDRYLYSFSFIYVTSV